uniref:ATP-grasp domain-containing protein n=1 Tax=Algoriphagus sp. TaxID=1872435 RepID=UPI004048CEDA
MMVPNIVKIGITGTGSLIGQAIIKSIRKEYGQNIKLVGFDYFTNTVGSFWCNSNYLLPDILKGSTQQIDWLSTICEIIAKEDIKLLFVGVDFELPLFAKYKLQIFSKTGCKVLVSDMRVIDIADDKYATFQFLKENGLYAPESWITSNLPVDPVFPLIIKPRRGARSVGVQKVENKEQLQKALSETKNPVIQEYVGDESTEYTCGIIFFDNELKHSIALNRVLKAGNTYLSRFSFETEQIIYKYISDIAYKLKPFGSCNLQLRVDSKGIPKLFEINARHSGTTYIRSLFGYNEVQYIIEHLLYNTETTFELKEGTVVRYYEEFFIE